MDKEHITCYGGPALGNSKMGKKGVQGKLARIFGQDHLTHAQKNIQKLFLLPAISQVPSTHTIKRRKIRPREVLKKETFQEKVTINDLSLIKIPRN